MSDLTALAQQHGLERIGKRPRLGRYLSEVWRRRSFAWTLSRYRLLESTARSRLGLAWLIIIPALQITIYGLIFGLILGDARPDNFIPFLIVGVALFQYLGGSFSDGAKSITSNESLAKSLSFPRALLPISAMVSQWLKFLGLLVLVLIALPLLGELPTWNWLVIIPVLLLATVFATGLAMIAARLTVQLSDLSQLIPFVLRVAFYSSGVFFSIEKLISAVPALWFLEWANPVSVYLGLARSALITGYEASAVLWWSGASWALGTLVLGFFFFWAAEERYGRVG